MPSNDWFCRLQSRMFRGDTPVFGEDGVRSHSITRRFDRPNGSGRSSAASASAKMALLTPTPSANVKVAMSVNAGADIICRTARRTSVRRSSSRIMSPQTELAGHWFTPCPVFGHRFPSWKTCGASSDAIQSIEINDLVPRGDEVADEFFARIGAGVDLRKCTELRIRSEDEVDATRGPPGLAILPAASLE